MVESFRPAETPNISSTTPSITSRTAKIALTHGANVDVSVYLKGRIEPIEWVTVPVYKTGYKPDFFWNEDGIDYPVYGPFSEITNGDGEIIIDVNSLEYPDGSKMNVSESYYTIYCETSSGATSKHGVVLLRGSSV